jgi:hypothetical protein
MDVSGLILNLVKVIDVVLWNLLTTKRGVRLVLDALFLDFNLPLPTAHR